MILEDGGHRAVFNLEDCRKALKTKKKYISGGNMLWGALEVDDGSTPINEGAVDKLRTDHLMDPDAEIPGQVVLAVPGGVDIKLLFGKMRFVSPREMVFAKLDAIMDDFDASASDETMEKHRKSLLGCEVKIVVVENWRALHIMEDRLRVQLFKIAKAVKFSAVQKIFRLMGYKFIHIKM